MAATGYTPIQLYYSTTPAATPSASNLLSGELAINIADGKLFYKDTGGSVQVLVNSSATSVNSISFGSTGLTPATTTTGAVTVAGTLAVGSGGTGLSSTPVNGALDIGNGTGFTRTTLTAGSGISVTNGSGSITIAATGGGLPTMNIVTGTTQTAVASNQYVLTNAAATTVTLPASPSAGDTVYVTVANNLTTNVVARNGSNIMSLAQNLTLDATYASAQLRYADATRGWVLT